MSNVRLNVVPHETNHQASRVGALWPSATAWLARLTALRNLEAGLAIAGSTVDLRCRRATLLDSLGRTDEAHDAYLAILMEAPDHAATLNQFGALLYRTGYRDAARTVFAQAACCHPHEPLGHVNLANLLYEDGDLIAACHHYEAALCADPDFAMAHQGLGNVFAARGEVARTEHHRRRGFHDRVFDRWVYRGQQPPVRVLLLTSVADGNLPARSFLDDDVFSVVAATMEFYTPDLPLPPHDVVVNAVGDADLCRPALLAAVGLLNRTSAPVFNHPAAVLATGRAENARRLGGISNVVAPRMALLPRAELTGPDGDRVLERHGFGWPLLLRAPGYHLGKNFVRVDAAADLAMAAAALPTEEVLAIEYLDSTGPDGLTRKGRVMMVDGQLYPLHWAISPHWKVHYFTAEMADRAEHRAEEARFLADMNGFLGEPAVAALAAIADRLALDYGGIDFGLGRDGEVLLFEANATMAILPPLHDAVWDYRRAASNEALAAARRMVMARGQRRA
jgi:tetratricopeptide (TPR) repeat protein